MVRSYLLLLLVLLKVPAFSQGKIKNYVVNNAATVNSISIVDTNYADLKALGNAIGNSRIVMLGEQDHGDAPTFKAKARIIKYLHEQHGFNVLAFESDFVGLSGGYEEVRYGSITVDSLLKGNLFPIWTTCTAFADTWQYLQNSIKTKNPMHLAGFDNQLHGAYTGKHLANLVKNVLANYSTESLFTNSNKLRYLSLLDSLVKYSATGTNTKSPLELEWFKKQSDGLLKQLKANPAVDAFALIALENARSICQHLLNKTSSKEFSSVFIERDVQMAKNLQWLATVKYPSEKIIVWAANAHISKNQFEVEPKAYEHQSLGAYFTKQLGFANQTYVLGFSSFEGTAGRTTKSDGKYQLPPREDNSFERWINKPGREFAFVNFRDFNRANPNFSKYFTMSASNHYQQKGAWTKAYDGIFFIRNMYACEITEH